MATKTKKTQCPDIHEWTNADGNVFVLRFSNKDGKSYNGFQHPTEVGEMVTAPDWTATTDCGGGIHGWPWGIGIGDGKEPEWGALWQVYAVKPADIISNVGSGPKCKFRTGELVYAGDWHGAMQYILPGQMKWAFEISEGAASNSGYQGAASNSGDYGAASNSGTRGAASNSGYQGAASNSGDQGAASNSGYQGAASNSGDYGAASTTADGTAAFCTGLNSKAKAAAFGCIALAWWNEKESRVEMRCSEIGKGRGKLKADTWYQLNSDGKFVETTE